MLPVDAGRNCGESGLLFTHRRSATHCEASKRSEPRKAAVAIKQQRCIGGLLSITAEDYLHLIHWTTRLTRGDKRGRIDATEPPALRKLGLREYQWHQQMLGTETNDWRAIESAQALIEIEKAAAIGQGCLKGIGAAQRRIRLQPA
jgi:hypothetical protein